MSSLFSLKEIKFSLKWSSPSSLDVQFTAAGQNRGIISERYLIYVVIIRIACYPIVDLIKYLVIETNINILFSFIYMHV